MRTLYTMIISILIPVICYEYDVIYDIDLTLISIAIIFPLVFAIRGAFRRREKALEHLSKIRSSLMSISNPETISRSVKGKVVGYLQKVQEGIENCLAIHIHRTPISLKAYCKIFIYIFPIIYTPSIINKIGVENPQWLTYFVIILSEFILISLYNIQDDMEYPFDKQGLDDIKLEEFLIKNQKSN